MKYYPISQSGRFDIDPVPLQEVAVGDFVSLDLNGFLTRGAPSVLWSVDGGALPPGLSLSADGWLSGTVAGVGGAFVAQVQADAGVDGLATQGVAWLVPQQGGGGGDTTVWATGTGGDVLDFVGTDGMARRAHVFNSTNVFNCTTAGWVFVRIYSGGGGMGHGTPNGTGGGAGGYREFRVWCPVGIHPVEVGAGGPPGVVGGTSEPNRPGYKGTPSSVFGISPDGGGGGAGGTTSTTHNARVNGGSGGGGVWRSDSTVLRRDPGVGVPYQGHRGGTAPQTESSTSGGGGGANGPGAGINGGDGVEYFLGVLRRVCGGGAGGLFAVGSFGAADYGASPAQSGAPNSGAGASGNGNAGSFTSGGSGRVEIIVGI